jgi:hypothetical protein
MNPHALYGSVQYGTRDRAKAEKLLALLQVSQPSNRFEVRAYETIGVTPVKWGVCRFEPYCSAMPWRMTGFVLYPWDTVR